MNMIEEERSLFLIFQIDANRINARAQLPYMNQLEHWADSGIILVEMSRVAYDEARSGQDQYRSHKVSGYIYSYTYADTLQEQQMIAEIARALFPGGLWTPNDWRDVEIVFNARKYGAILVTADGAILDRSRELAARFHINVMTDEQAVAFVRSRIRARDERARQHAEDSSTQVPEWVGKD
jgi:predicted nuclease of predicted toxin-antitoxin system